LGTPAIFNFSAGAPKEALAIDGCVGALTVICADEMQGLTAKQPTARRVLHKRRKSDLFTMASML
jgi:hypothetical protein